MAKTGYLIVVYQDVNPSSPTYNTTREERTQSEEFCPTSAPANWIEYTRYCEMNEHGMNSGYEIIVYMDVEPLSSTYNETRESRVLNTEECMEDNSTPNWQNIGEPFCRQKIYMPSGLMGNDGYMVQQQQDMNEYSPTGGEIKEIATLDLENCPLPSDEPIWEIIHENCHIIQYNGELVFDGTKDITRVDTNPFSPSFNDNIPETINVQDPINCPTDVVVEYRWTTIGNEYVCVGYDKYSMQKKQYSIDGVSWTDVTPLETRTGILIEENSEFCGYTPPPTPTDYRWVTVSGSYECVGFDKYTVEKKQQSTDSGATWTDVIPSETRIGQLAEANSTECGYIEVQYRWVDSGEYNCVGYDKYTVQKKQQSLDNGTTWTDVTPLETRTGELVEMYSTYCGYTPPSILYRWINADDYDCVGYDKYAVQKKQQSTNSGATWTDVIPLTYRQGALIESDSNDCKCGEQYFTTEIVTDGTIELYQPCSSGDTNLRDSLKDVYYSKNDGEWVSYYFNYNNRNTLNVVTGDVIRWKGLSMKSGSIQGTNYNTNYTTVYSTADYIVYGNLKSLIFSDDFTTYDDSNIQLTFEYLFSPCADKCLTPTENTHLLSAENLIIPSNTISCRSMFVNCTSLVSAPRTLPPTTLTEYGFASMFKDCTSLVDIPRTLNVTTMGYAACVSMFENCTSITSAPVLPATTLAKGCYASMFKGCTSLTSPPAILPATTLTDNCYENMFYGCTSLTIAPELPATKLADGCYRDMFNGCTNLTNIQATLPATTLAGYCYYAMFSDCTSLTTAPELPATTLASNCYNYMFRGCTNLNYINAMFLSTPGSSTTYNWVDGVAATGTFVKNGDATWNEIGVDGVPTGWTIQTLPQYRWTNVSGQHICVGYDKYFVEKKQYSMDFGTTWVDVTPLQTRIGELIESNSESCGYKPSSTQYRWVTVSGSSMCVAFGKYTVEKKQYSMDGTTWYDVTPLETKAGSLIESNSNDCGYAYASQYLTIEALTSGTVTIRATYYYNLEKEIAYSRDNGTTWTTMTTSETEQSFGNLNAGEKILLKGENAAYGNSYNQNRFGGTANVKIYGNIMSLVYGDNFVGQTTLDSKGYNFNYLFSQANVVNAENLILPATTLTQSCYDHMFAWCELLTSAPKLPATTLAQSCYRNMFNGCTSLTTAPQLPATTLAQSCYHSMFYNCTSITTAPELPATTLTNGCYNSMFQGCTGLTTAPELPAATLARNCYNYIFKNCSNLNYIKALFTTTPSTLYTLDWVIGVAASGGFVKSVNATWNVTGYYGVPYDWKVATQ